MILAWVVLLFALDDLQTAQQLAWNKQFAEAEAMYRRLPDSPEKRLGLARVLLWTGRYDEAIALFDTLDSPDAIEGRATAHYWRGDLRSAVRDFRRVDDREYPRQALAEIASISAPSQRINVDASHDDQPLDAIRTEIAATMFSDPLTRWTATVGGYHLDHDRRGMRDGTYVRIDNETKLVNKLTITASLGVFEFPDGVRKPLFGLGLRYDEFTLSVQRREELAAATSLVTHAHSTTTTLRWNRDTPRYLAAAEASRRRYFDDNSGQAFVAYAVVPLIRPSVTFSPRGGEKGNAPGEGTLWLGASVALRDTDQSRFNVTATSSTLDPLNFFHYQYRGEYDPYWTPDDQREVRLVAAYEQPLGKAHVKLHADAGYARDRGRAFGPDAGPGPFPQNVFAFSFDRTYHPWRAGITASYDLSAHYRIEAAFERGATVDYRANTFHAAVVRRR